MPKQTVVVEFDDKELRDLLLTAAKQALGKTIQGSAEVSITGTFGKTPADPNGLSGPMHQVSCKITFNGKVG